MGSEMCIRDSFLRAAGGLQIARGGGRGPRRARRQRGAAAPSGDDRAGEREHHDKRQKRRAVKGSSKGFFHRQWGVLSIRLSIYVQSFGARCLYQHELARRVALEYFSTSACRTRSTGRARSTGPVDHPRGARGPAGQLSGRDPTNPWSGGADRGPTSRASTGRRRACCQTRPWTAPCAGGRGASMRKETTFHFSRSPPIYWNGP